MQEAGRIRPGSVRPKVVPINDGLISLVSGMGTTTDPRSWQRYHSRWMSDHDIDQAYRASWVMRRIIDKPATEMVREWRDWQGDSDDIGAIEAEEKRLGLRSKVRTAERLRGLGGAGMVIYVDGDQTQPLDPATVKKGGIRAIHVWHRCRFNLGPMIEDWASPWFGHPSWYEMTLTSGPMRFHPSRVVAFKADPVGEIVGVDWQTCFWGQSRVQTVIDAVQNVDAADSGFAALIKDARNRRIYIPKLLEHLATAEGEAILSKRLQAFALGESSYSVSWLDGGDGEGKGAEKIEDRQMSWAGMPDLMNSYRTAAASSGEMPVTVLWGTSPAGLNATGQSDKDLWEQTIKGKQDLDLDPCLAQSDPILIASALGRVDDGIWHEWPPLSTQSEKDEATTLWNTAQGLQIISNMGVVPDVAMSEAVQDLFVQRGWLPALESALAKIPEDERFLETPAPELDANGDPIDPNALQASSTGGKEVDPKSPTATSGEGSAARRRAAKE